MPAVAALPVVLVRSPSMRTAPRPVLEMLYGALDRLARSLRAAWVRDLFVYFGDRARYEGVDQFFRGFRLRLGQQVDDDLDRRANPLTHLGKQFRQHRRDEPESEQSGQIGFADILEHFRLGTMADAAQFNRRELVREWQLGELTAMAELDKQKAVDLLNRILELELAGVVRYTHYSFLVFGHNRIPIVSWLREQAAELLTHAQQAGEMITLLGEYPSLEIGPLLDTHRTDIGAIMRESLETEAKALALYRELLKCAEGRSVILEEYARQMVYAEELHASEVDKMLRKPGEVAAFRPTR